MEGPSGYGGLSADGFGDPPAQLGRGEGDDGYDSWSGSENSDARDGPGRRNMTAAGKRRKYFRHTPEQIQVLENFFKDCQHPNEKQRLEIGRKLGLGSKQVKFWFQNRRTYVKTRQERQENTFLKFENEKLRREILLLKEQLRNPMGQECGGPTLPDGISDESQLRMENARLKKELAQIGILTEKVLGMPISEMNDSISNPWPNPKLDPSAGISSTATGPATTDTTPLVQSHPVLVNPENEALNAPYVVSSTAAEASDNNNNVDFEMSVYVQVAMSAMDELITLAHGDRTLWVEETDGTKEVLNYDAYMNRFSPVHGMKPPGFVTDATKGTVSAFIATLDLVDTLMDTKRWVEMFPCIVGKASTMGILCSGVGGTHDGELQMIEAEFLFPTPLIPLCQAKFLRYCKRRAEDVWAVVDISTEIVCEGPMGDTSLKSRRLPSGCMVQDLTNGCLVTWVEHVEYDETAIHDLYRSFMLSGLAFGAHRWLATLQRQCHGSAFLATNMIPDPTSGMTADGRKSVLKLTKRITSTFFAGISASSLQRWEKLEIDVVGDLQIQVMARVSVDEPGEPSGIVLSAATSVWLPVSRKDLFDILRNQQFRDQWDILSGVEPVLEMTHIAKDQEGTNRVSLLCAPVGARNAFMVAPDSEGHMMILQEVWSDTSGSAIIYAPVDALTIDLVMGGGDSDYLALLPSGFAIVDAFMGNNGGGSLLTLAFQITVNSIPTAKLSVESIQTIKCLISCTINKIMSNVYCP